MFGSMTMMELVLLLLLAAPFLIWYRRRRQKKTRGAEELERQHATGPPPLASGSPASPPDETSLLIEDRMYQEEKARQDAKARLALEAKRAGQRRRLRRWGPVVVGLLVLFVWGLSKSNPTAPPPRPGPPCQLKTSMKLVKEVLDGSILSSIDGPQVFVGPGWYMLTIQQKEGLDHHVQCWLRDGHGGRLSNISYRDARTGKEVASSDYALHMK